MFGRLIPAVHATAIVAAVAHVASLAYVSGSMGFEGFGVAALTYIMTFVAAIPLGIVLLTVTVFFQIGLKLSLVIFLVSAPLAVVAVSTILFGFDPESIPLEYGYMAFPSAVAAWYFSVYHEWKKDRDNTHT